MTGEGECYANASNRQYRTINWFSASRCSGVISPCTAYSRLYRVVGNRSGPRTFVFGEPMPVSHRSCHCSITIQTCCMGSGVRATRIPTRGRLFPSVRPSACPGLPAAYHILAKGFCPQSVSRHWASGRK